MDLSRARILVETHGRSSLDYFKLLPGRLVYFSTEGEAFLAYRKALGSAVVLGDPVGPRDKIEALVRDFKDETSRHGGSVVFLQAGPDFLDCYHRLGLTAVRVGVLAVVDLTSFDLARAWAKPLRNVLHKVVRLGLTVHHLSPPLDDLTLSRLRATNASWLTIPHRFERGFTVGRFDEETIRCCPVSLLEEPGGCVAAFTNWVPSSVRGEATVDLIRRRADAPNGVLDALFTEVLLEARRRGFRRFDLGLVPFAGLPDGPLPDPAERVIRWLYRHTDFLFHHRGLYFWKSKFHPTWKPRWLVYRAGPLSFARAGWAVRRVGRV